jgi:hypothetical protein
MNIRIFRFASVLGWIIGAAIIVSLFFGTRFPSLAALGSRDARAAHQQLTEQQAITKAADWARPYLQETLGQDRSLGSLSLDDMELVDVRFVPNARELVTSVTTAVSLPEEKDVWVVSWERGGVPNVTTGRADGTAHLVLVMDDETGRVTDAVAGIRQPEDQARKPGSAPSFDELLGDAIARFEQRDTLCSAAARKSPGVVVPISC